MHLCVLCVSVVQLPAQELPRRYEETITSSRHEFTLHMGGTMDGSNTRDPVFSSAPAQAFEPMRSVRIENIGDSDVVNPWIIVNGKRDWRTTRSIVEEALRAHGGPSAEAEKARAIYEFLRRHRFHATSGDLEVRDPVKALNVYGFGLCGDTAAVLMDLWRQAGLRVRRGFPSGHCVSEVWYDGGWHLLDADESGVYLERDNETIAGDRQLARDHDLVKRAAGEDDAALWSYDGRRDGEYPSHVGHTMSLTLRPGEGLEWRWRHAGKHHQAPSPLYALGNTHLKDQWGEKAWAQLANGGWIYAPPLGKPSAQRAAHASNVQWSLRRGHPAATPAKTREPAMLTWKIESPYVIVGGSLAAHMRCRPGGAFSFSISFDEANWRKVAGGCESDSKASLDDLFPDRGPARYRYWLRLEMSAKRSPRDVGLESLVIENDLQMAPLSLPSLALGENKIAYTDETADRHAVRVTFDWLERGSTQPPAPPERPLFPEDRSDVEGARVSFQWSGQAAAYHFQLAPDPAIRWPLSSAFDRVVDAPAFEMTRPGLLNPDTRYYWRVRAKNAAGVWGSWSHVWSFSPRGPGVPWKVRFIESGPNEYKLMWESNPRGRRPASYRIYASNEKGFSAADAPYPVATGNQKERGNFPGRETVQFPGNLIETTTVPYLLLKPQHAFYRVVAVDEKGNRSGPSDYGEAPRPFIYTEPVSRAKSGSPYRYEVKTISSIGDLTYRDFPPEQFYQAAFWDAEEPEFSLVDELGRCGNPMPAWLRIDPRSGVLSGTPGPEDAGEYQINVMAEIKQRGVYIQSFPLRVSP